ncbi:hypothetical protein HKBW3S34_01633 [Candidatus Hakubella thermalkaliphila]|uniref:Uncharacterized protein n=1 Tax=Candidatus Hakubella thermalkaliphila TaxID=2754717 RepID=A0A6V8PEE0_9ACTN|nr:hypothetical protein HKBW3S34_01633 [Candidatus Hakubella thermalkaliphila]
METSGMVITILAIWGTVLSSVSIGWQMYRDFTNRGRLRVDTYLANIIEEGPGPQDQTVYLAWKVTNTGRKPIIINPSSAESP